MSQYPSQLRSVDPFASYNSDTVNKLVRTVTHGENALEKYDSYRGTIDGTATVIINTGVAYKDDVRIQALTPTTVDFKSALFYQNMGAGFDEDGYYYILLEYHYEKSRPAPQAKFVILKPSQRTAFLFPNNWLFLHAVRVQWNGTAHVINTIYDYDPENPSQVKREYIKVFVGAETQIEPFTSGDQGRVVYDIRTDKFYFGYVDRWGEGGGGGSTELTGIDTAGVSVGDICKIDSTGFAVATIATDLNNQADLVATTSSTDGRGVIAGLVEEVPVETGQVINIGDIIYLSALEAGKVTNVRTTPVYQILGRSLSQGSQTTPISMIFSPKVMLTGSFEGTISSWTASGGSPAYYNDIDISNLDATAAVLCNFFDNATQLLVTPPQVAYLGTILRVYNNNNTDVINYIISGISGGDCAGGGGGGGGPAITNHALLTNLSYAASGHTGFAPTPHGNTHHSVNYIVSTDVNFTNLNANGSVGSGGAQVAIGNHTHTEFSNRDIPSGEMILFWKNTAVTGYNLITSVNDYVVYITKGSGAGGPTGGAWYPGTTWTQPSHSHGIPDHNHYYAHRHYVSVGNHQHSYSGTTSYENCTGADRCSGGDNSHSHTYSGWTDAAGATTPISNYPYESYYTNYAGLTSTNGTVPPIWRPNGVCMTLQQRI